MRKITGINRAEQTMLIQGLEQLLAHYNSLRLRKQGMYVERYEFLQDKALELYHKLEDREITEIRIEEVKPYTS